MSAQSGITAKAAAIQEQYDFFVFGMPSTTDRSSLPLVEEISAFAGPDAELRKIAVDEKLLGWYDPIDVENSGLVTVAISQRANAAYADNLLQTTAKVWATATAVWCVLLVAAGVVADLSLLTFLVGFFLPVLPAFLDVVEYVASIRRASRDRGDLARAIEHKLTGRGGRVLEAQDLLVWQEELHSLRRSDPQVPDFVYQLKRRTAERAMKSGAEQLGRRAKDSGQ